MKLKIWEMDDFESHNSVNALSVTEPHSLTWLKYCFILREFYHNKKMHCILNRQCSFVTEISKPWNKSIQTKKQR